MDMTVKAQLRHKKINPEKVIGLILDTERLIFNESLVQDVTEKGRADFVTRVDMAVQAYLSEKLAQLYPEIGMIGEEGDRIKADPEKDYWILDPIDGTTNLIHHYGMSAVSLGLYEKGKMTFGVVYNPFHKELFTASLGCGAYRNGKEIRVLQPSELKNALISYGSSPYEKERAAYLFPLYEKLFMESADFRRSGSAALDLCYVACGRSDVYLEQFLKPWDYAAGALILEEAGGTVTDWKGGELPYLVNADILATGGKLQERMIRILKENRTSL